ncbi:hypothetical protein FLL45_11450 [Aliikangiella marina]|uniref:Lipoprotein n=1 Tax=Aliikangiella marina TaxID=1712262 RepID=A0A545TE69_9GAMM|nr:YajG family lipoprotein [Aliikangiella marina]TQV75523.1 hypothetical protein FLL45_11450 [Aliikangiella marina]
MRLINPKLLLVIGLISFLAGCTTEKLNFGIDPEISSVQQLSRGVQQISVSVNEQLPDNIEGIKKDLIIANGPDDPAGVLRNKILDQLKANQFRIISNPLLADLSLSFTIETLYATVDTGMFKSEINAVSHIRVQAKKQGKTFEKVYRNTRKQEVANPANEIDVTGVVNQMLTQQMTAIFTDPRLLALTNG